MQVKVRKAIIEDASRLGYVHYYAWLETYTGLINETYLAKLSTEKSTEMFKRMRCQNTFVAIVNDEIVGFCGAYGNGRDADLQDSGEIQGIYVLREFQRQSIGKQLLEFAIKELAKQGYKHVYLWVLSTNQQAIDFYEKNGFQFDDKEKSEVLVTPIIEKRYIRNL